jgi:hypothetical protein
MPTWLNDVLMVLFFMYPTITVVIVTALAEWQNKKFKKNNPFKYGL